MNLSIHISSLFVSLFERYTHLVGKRRDPLKASSPESKKLRKKKKEELYDPLYVPPEEVHKTIRKNKSNHKKTPEEMCLEDGVVGEVHVAEEEHVVLVSCSLKFYNLYDFIYYFKSFIIRTRITNQSICHSPPIRNHQLYEIIYYVNSYII